LATGSVIMCKGELGLVYCRHFRTRTWKWT